MASTRSNKRDIILEAATRVFAEKGYRAARVSDVAREAGVADGTIYLYFKSKEEMLLSIFETKMEQMLAGIREALAQVPDLDEKIRRFAVFHLDQVRLDREVAEVLQVELRLSKKFMKEYRPEQLWAYLGVFSDILRQGKAEGRYREDVDPFLAGWAFFGSMDEIAMQWVLARNPRRFSLEAAAAQVADIFLRGIRA
ncbi:MAG: TetR/AcrR family transcriptional regulator [Deltaproteobacteria bacterium]|nr:TetR/AcrR family transcriptional regulator [Deltaproteobacteria bacterium]